MKIAIYSGFGIMIFIGLELTGLSEFFKLPGAFGNESFDCNDLPAIAAQRINEHLGASLPPEQFIVIGDTPHGAGSKTDPTSLNDISSASGAETLYLQNQDYTILNQGQIDGVLTRQPLPEPSLPKPPGKSH